MHPEDRMILSSLLSDAKITNDIWFACEQGFIPSKDLAELVNSNNYEDLLVSLFNDWYETKANPEQQLLADLNGYFHLNDQFDDLKTIIALSIENRMTTNTPEQLNDQNDDLFKIPLNLFEDDVEDDVNIDVINLSEYEKDNPIKIFMSEEFTQDFPLRTIKDLENNTNVVYVLNCMGRENWRVLVQGILFRLKNNSYEGKTVQGAMDWLIHNIEIKKQRDLKFARELCDGEAWKDDNDEIKLPIKENKSFLAKELNLKKSKEENYAKKAIKRGLKLLSNFIEDKDFNLFNTKDGFIVDAKLFNYKFRKGHTSIISHTLNPTSYHIPYDLIVLNKDNVELANMCIYFDETPMIDQIVSTILHLKSDNEKEILFKGNFYNKKKEFYTDPIIRQNFHNGTDMELEYEQLLERELKSPEERERDSHLYEKISSSVFKAFPTFLGVEIPEFVYREFSNITFDAYFDRYVRDGDISAPILSSDFPIKIENELIEIEAVI